MKELQRYIVEKFKISKDIKNIDNKEVINNNFITALKNYLNNFYNISLGTYPDTISICGKNNDFLLLTLGKSRRIYYKSIMSFINKSYPLRKECKTNNQSIYIYPDYEES